MIRFICSVAAVLIIQFVVFSDEDNKAQISLLTETNDVSEPFYIGIYFEMQPEWYIYWKNPGDAGIPVGVEWNLPDGYRVSELIYPTPGRFDTQGLISFGYKDEALLFVKVTPPVNNNINSEPVISADVSWMVCKESCFLEDGTAEINLASCEPTPEIFERYKNKLPKSLDRASTRITSIESEKKEGRFFITIHLEGEPVDDFFPGPVEDFILQHKNIEINDHKITYTLRPYSDSTVVDEVTGLLFINGAAFQFNQSVSNVN